MADLYASLHPPTEVSFQGRCSSPSNLQDHEYSPLSSPESSPLPKDDTLREEEDPMKLVTVLSTPRSAAPFDEGGGSPASRARHQAPTVSNCNKQTSNSMPGLLHMPQAEDLSKLLPPRLSKVSSRDDSPVMLQPTRWKDPSHLQESPKPLDELHVALVTPETQHSPLDIAMAPTDEKPLAQEDDWVISSAPTDEMGRCVPLQPAWESPNREHQFQTKDMDGEPGEIGIVTKKASKELDESGLFSAGKNPSSNAYSGLLEPQFSSGEDEASQPSLGQQEASIDEPGEISMNSNKHKDESSFLEKSILIDQVDVSEIEEPGEISIEVKVVSGLELPTKLTMEQVSRPYMEQEQAPRDNRNISAATPSSPFSPTNFSFEDSPLDEMAARSNSSSVDSVRQDTTRHHLGVVKRNFMGNQTSLDRIDASNAGMPLDETEGTSPEDEKLFSTEKTPDKSFASSWNDIASPPTWAEMAPMDEQVSSQPPVLRRLNPSSCSSSHDRSSLSNFEPTAPVVLEEEPPSLSRSADSLAAVSSTISRSRSFEANGAPDPPDAVYAEKHYDDDSSSCATDGLIEDLQCMVKDLDESIRGKSPASSPSETARTCTDRSEQTKAACDPEPVKGGLPAMINPLNNDIGIPKGDIMISLLQDDDAERDWGLRLYESTWRCRTVRRNCDTVWLREKLTRDNRKPGLGRSSVLADADDGRISATVEATQAAAIQHLKYDELSDALDLYEDILDRYENLVGGEDLHHYVGLASYNVGVVQMLRGEFQLALDAFQRVKATNGGKHVDRVVLLSRMGICLFALAQMDAAEERFREALMLARRKRASLPDRRQCAEILNNLACLCYTLGSPKEAIVLFRESLGIQSTISEDSLYLGSKFSCHASSMNLAVLRANLGFLSLVSRDLSTARLAFEAAVQSQSLLLRDAHVTLVSTMDHLAVVHLLANNKERALQLLRRVQHMQIDAFGRKDRRAHLTGSKIRMIEGKEGPGKLEAALSAIPSLEQPKGQTEVRGKKPATRLRSLNPLRKWNKG